MAPTGHSTAHLPWPMHFEALISVATPSTRPRIFPSGQALMHEPLPMQTSGSMTGCKRRRDVQLELDGFGQLLLARAILQPAAQQVDRQHRDREGNSR